MSGQKDHPFPARLLSGLHWTGRKRRTILFTFAMASLSIWLLFISIKWESDTDVKNTPDAKASDKVELVLVKPVTKHFSVTPKTVLILTPLKNAAGHLPRYFDIISAFEYPKDLLSLGFLISDSNDGTLNVLQNQVTNHQKSSAYRSVTIIEHNFHPAKILKDRHEFEAQVERRSLMAMARNYLVSTALTDEEWVLWIDSDLSEIRPSLLNDLLSYEKDIIVPNCMMHWEDKWAETNDSWAFLETRPPEEIIFEGYPNYDTKRIQMNHIFNKTSEEIMRVHGVGGTVLLVRGDVHRSGANFPAYNYRHAIETEGFAKMAESMGYEAYGLPNYAVFH